MGNIKRNYKTAYSTNINTHTHTTHHTHPLNYSFIFTEMGRKQLKNRRQSRRRPINDVPKNNTNIRVRFRKAITFTYANFQSKILLDPEISTLTKDLGVIYKLWRCTHLSLEFQAASNNTGTSAQPRYAINYVPALEATTALLLNIEDYEGPAVGYWQSNRGHPYRYQVPSNVLNAMPYNWYGTKSNTPDATDRVQGMILSTCDFEEDTQTALLDIVFEFQTLEDPDFLASLAKHNVCDGKPSSQIEVTSSLGEKYDLADAETRNAGSPLVRRSVSRARAAQLARLRQ